MEKREAQYNIKYKRQQVRQCEDDVLSEENITVRNNDNTAIISWSPTAAVIAPSLKNSLGYVRVVNDTTSIRAAEMTSNDSSQT